MSKEILESKAANTIEIQTGHTVAGVVPEKKEIEIITRVLSEKTIADEIASRITGRLIDLDDLYDPKTQKFLTENDLKAKGAVIVALSMNKKLTAKDTVQKNRTTGEPTPVIIKKSKFQLLVNVDWEKYINKRSSHGNFVAAQNSPNKTEIYNGCKAVRVKDNHYYISGVVHRYLGNVQYFDENGIEYNPKMVKKEYLKKVSKNSKQKEADKHGIDIKFDPDFRSVRIDSCDEINVFSFHYVPKI